MRLKVGFVLLPDFTLIAASGFIDALRVAADEFDHSRQIHCSWTIMAPNLEPIRSSSGVSLQPFEIFRVPSEFDYIVIVGGLLDSQRKADPGIAKFIRQAAAKGVPLIGACTGSFFLARIGLMEGHRCCVHQFHLAEFEAEFPTLSAEADHLFLVDGNRITCPGGGSIIDLAIHLIERHCGRDRALKTVCQFIVEDARAHNYPQARLAFDPISPVSDPLVRRVVLLMEQNIGNALTISHIAGRLHTNVRRIERLFLRTVGGTPTDFYRRLRLERVRWLLENSHKRLAEIAYDCGFSDGPHLSRTWRQVFGSTPSEYRKKQGEGVRKASLTSESQLLPQLLPRQAQSHDRAH